MPFIQGWLARASEKIGPQGRWIIREVMMKKLVAIAIAMGVMAGMASVADARDGCGRGMARGPQGRCHVIGRPGQIVVAPGRLIIGNFYAGRGYWDGRRYYQHRERRHNGWRYR
jgi:hypothetical protein